MIGLASVDDRICVQYGELKNIHEMEPMPPWIVHEVRSQAEATDLLDESRQLATVATSREDHHFPSA